MEYRTSGIVADTQLMGVNRLVQLASDQGVVLSRDEVPLVFGNPVDRTESLFQIVPAARVVPGIVERLAKEEVSHCEIRIDRSGALKQRYSSQKMPLAHLRISRSVVLKSFQ